MSAGTRPAAPTGRRIKSVTIVAVLLLSGLAFLAWSQSWGSLLLSGSSTTEATLDVPGSVAAPALSALALAGIALAGALAIAGPVIRLILGVLEVLLGVSVLWSAIGALADPVAAGSSVVTTSTGVAGLNSIREIVSAGPSSPWPAVTAVLGVAMILLGLVVIVTVRRWPASSRKYQAVTFAAEDGRESGDPADFFDEGDERDDSTGEGDDGPGDDDPAGSGPGHAADDEPARRARDAAVDDWDSLSRGTDPTR